MTRTARAIPALLLTLVAGSVALVAAPAQARGFTVPVQCETGAETLLSWDDVAYDLRGTCGVVRITADDATVTMPAATRLVVEGTGNAVSAKPLTDVQVLGAGTTITTPSMQTLTVGGAGSRITVTGLLERATLASTSSTLTADTINVLRLRGTDAVTARKAFRARITGSDNALALARAGRLVLTGDRNAVTVARGRTTLRDRGEANVLDLRRRRR